MNDIHDQIEPSTQMAGSGTGGRTSWTPSRRHFLTITGLALGGAALGLGVSACGTAQTGSSRAGQGSRRCGRGDAVRRRLPMGSAEELQPVRGCARLAHSPGPEPVHLRDLAALQHDRRLAPPGLAKELKQPDDQTMSLPLQDGTKWSDGSDLTADDVVFTFELGKTASVYFATLWKYVDSVKATDPHTVEIKLKSDPTTPVIVKNSLARVLIVPKAVLAVSPRTRSQPIPTSSRSAPVRSCWTSTTRPRSTSRATTTTGARPSSGRRR